MRETIDVDEQTIGMAGIGVIGVVGIGAIVFGGDTGRVTETIAFATAIAGMIAALVRGGGMGGGGTSND